MKNGKSFLAPPEDNSQPRFPLAYEVVIAKICQLPWQILTTDEVMEIAQAYYYFSVQFRENLEIACGLYPGDRLLKLLYEGECDTDNLSPWLGVAAPHERMNHDEFIKRLLSLTVNARQGCLVEVGCRYLNRVRAFGNVARAASIASYEDGGLSRVFEAILRVPDWNGAGPRAFRHFLEEHIRFDADNGGGHGALARHLRPGDAVLPLWTAFADLLVAAVPRLASPRAQPTQHAVSAEPWWLCEARSFGTEEREDTSARLKAAAAEPGTPAAIHRQPDHQRPAHRKGINTANLWRDV